MFDDKGKQMIISSKYKFIFVKTKKTASTSIEVYLSSICDKGDIVTPIIPPVDGHEPRNVGPFFNHMPAVDIRKNIPETIWESYLKFTIERNPWDKVLSYYYFIKQLKKYKSLSFDEYLKINEWPLNFPLYTDQGDEGLHVIVDEVLRYENLNSELGRVFRNLGIKYSGELNVWVKAEYRQDHRPYQEIYTMEQADLISKVFEEEIKMHGYKY
jgi:hypothetical protein